MAKLNDVTPDLPNPNQIINELVGFFNTFLSDMRSLGYTYAT